METNQSVTNRQPKDAKLGVTESKNCSETEIFTENSSKDGKFSKLVSETKIVLDDSSLDRRFWSPIISMAEGMPVSEENTAQKKFHPRKKVVYGSNTGSGGSTLQRRFSPRLKDIPESKRPCHEIARKCLRCRQYEQNVDKENNADCNSNHTTNPDASRYITGKSDCKIDIHSFEENGLQGGSSRTDSGACSMRTRVGMSNVVHSLTNMEGGYCRNTAQEVGKWSKGCDVTTSAYDEGAYERVKETIRTFNIYYHQFVQEEENEVQKLENNVHGDVNGVKCKRQDAFEDHVKASNRPDLKALSKMFETKAVMYPVKRFGHLPGIDIGYQFHSRAEMVALGFHSDWLYRIDYMGESYEKMMEYKDLTFPLAVAVVLSGEYEEDQDYSEDIFYSSESGSDLLGNKHKLMNQVMSCCNIALRNNLEQSIPVRVVRGKKSDKSSHHKVYTYDGLYEVYESLIQKDISGGLVYKYRLRRLEGQPKLTTNQVNLTRDHKVDLPAKLPGLVCVDISGGQEEFCIPAFNLIDDASFPSLGFTYSKDIQVAENVELPTNADGCRCKGNCKNPKTCACARLNGSTFPYVRHGGGRLLKAKDVVFECGPNCGCGPDCINRISQRAIKYQLEVFRTPDRGWAVRTRDFIPSGAPVCEYVGVLRRTTDADEDSDNDYVFEIDCLHTIKGIGGREDFLCCTEAIGKSI